MNHKKQNWKRIKVRSMFNIRPTKYYKNISKDDLNDGGTVPFVVNSAVNNGIGGYSSLPPTEKGNIITFSDTTNGNTFFYQPKDFIGFSHVQGMYPIERDWTKNELLYLITILTFVTSGRYNYGRKMTRENILETYILLPYDRDEPDWIYMDTYIGNLTHTAITTNIPKTESIEFINANGWKDFLLHKIFDVEMGNGIDAIMTTTDNPEYNYVSRNSNGNGVVSYIDEIENQPPFPAGAMTLALGGSFLGSCFIQRSPFYTGQNVAVLQEKVSLSIHAKLFIATLIRNECKLKYQGFGRELNSHFRKDFIIKLPIQHNNGTVIIDPSKNFSDEGFIPDWQYMEEYIKRLPYSDML